MQDSTRYTWRLINWKAETMEPGTFTALDFDCAKNYADAHCMNAVLRKAKWTTLDTLPDTIGRALGFPAGYCKRARHFLFLLEGEAIIP